MNFLTAKHAGFCFGVANAVDRVRTATDEGDKRIYTLGKLIHNPVIVEDFEKKGVCVISEDDIDRVYERALGGEKSAVVIRAHGVKKELYIKLADYSDKCADFSFIDCTCPCLTRIHKIVSEHTDKDSLLLIIGDSAHPEVEGIKSFSNGDVLICNKSEELEFSENAEKIASARLVMVSQTTQNQKEWKKCQKIIQKVCTNAEIFDTICSVTEERQKETEEISKKSDVMLVIGGHESSNTNKLFEIAKNNCERTYFVEKTQDLSEVDVTPYLTVGITAGASAPGSIIQEVIKTMSEQFANENFAEMLEDSLRPIYTGETVRGIITSVSQNEIHVDLGTKVTGIIPFSEVTDDPQEKLVEVYHVGDEIEAVVSKVSDLDGVAMLSRRRMLSTRNWQTVVDAKENGTILEGRVTEAVKGGVIIAIKLLKLFVPASQTGIPVGGDLGTLIGTTQKVKIIEINEQRHRAVASIKAVLREERLAKEAEFWASIEKDKEYVGEVKSLTAYGAFVDLGGVDGMVHTSELSWRRIKHPSEVVSVGEKIKVYVKDFNTETKRISLGYKTEETNPWNIFNSKYQVGDVAPVKIVSMMPFGAFAEIVLGADGLIHISQIADRKIGKPADVLEIGQVVDAKITDIDMENHKISLSIRALIEKEEEVAEAEEAVEEAVAAEEAVEAEEAVAEEATEE